MQRWKKSTEKENMDMENNILRSSTYQLRSLWKAEQHFADAVYKLK